MPAARDDHRVVGRRFVEFPAGGHPALGEQALVPARRADDPRARRRPGRARGDARLHVGDGAGVEQLHRRQVQPEIELVNMGIDQPGHRGASAEVEDLGIGSRVGPDLFRAADGDEASFAYGHGLRCGGCLIDGADLPVGQDDVGRARTGHRPDRAQRTTMGDDARPAVEEPAKPGPRLGTRLRAGPRQARNDAVEQRDVADAAGPGRLRRAQREDARDLYCFVHRDSGGRRRGRFDLQADGDAVNVAAEIARSERCVCQQQPSRPGGERRREIAPGTDRGAVEAAGERRCRSVGADQGADGEAVRLAHRRRTRAWPGRIFDQEIGVHPAASL